MAPRRKDPDPLERIETLRRERVRLAIQRNTLEAEMTAAQATVDAFPDRHRQALVDEARGRGDAVREVEADAAQARATVADRGARCQALRAAELEIESEIEDIEAAEIRFFGARAHELSVASVEAHAAARQALMAAIEARREATAAWSYIRKSRRQLGWPALSEVPVDDGGSVLSAFEALARWAPWPGGRRPTDEQVPMAWSEVEFSQSWERPRRTSLSRRDALMQIGEG